MSRVKDLRFVILDEQLFYQDFPGKSPTLHENEVTITLAFNTLEKAFDQVLAVDKQINRDCLRFTEQKTPKITCELCGKTGHGE